MSCFQLHVRAQLARCAAQVTPRCYGAQGSKQTIIYVPHNAASFPKSALAASELTLCADIVCCMHRWLAHACHVPTLLEVTTERACVQQVMGYPPSMPAVAVACRATVLDNKKASSMADEKFQIVLDCLVASEDGSRVHRLRGCCTTGSDTNMQLDAAHSLGSSYGQLLRNQAAQWV
eukprot:351491-Chlamydomonas_euryale.AAC.18